MKASRTLVLDAFIYITFPLLLFFKIRKNASVGALIRMTLHRVLLDLFYFLCCFGNQLYRTGTTDTSTGTSHTFQQIAVELPCLCLQQHLSAFIQSFRMFYIDFSVRIELLEVVDDC